MIQKANTLSVPNNKRTGLFCWGLKVEKYIVLCSQVFYKDKKGVDEEGEEPIIASSRKLKPILNIRKAA